MKRGVALACLALLAVAGPVTFSLERSPGYSAMAKVVGVRVDHFPAPRHPDYLSRLLQDPTLRLRMSATYDLVPHRAAPFTAIPHITVRSITGVLLGVAYHAATPVRARDVVNDLANQLVDSSQRELQSMAKSRIALLNEKSLRNRGSRYALVGELAGLKRLVRVPPPRVHVAAFARRPALRTWADRLADKLPGGFPTRPAPAAAGLAGLLLLAVFIGIKRVASLGRDGADDRGPGEQVLVRSKQRADSSAA